MQTKKMEFKLNINFRRLLIWLFVLFMFLPSLVKFFLDGSGLVKNISLSEVISEVKLGKVEKIQIRGNDILVYYPKESNGTEVMAISRKEEGSSFMDQLQKAGVDESKVKVEAVSQDFGKAFWDVISLLLPIVGFGLLMMFMMKKQGGGVDMFGIGKSKAKLFAKGKQNVKFSDVAGVDEAKKELEEVVDFLKNSKKYIEVGARTPKGVLLTGPAGVGKTLLARAVAGEAGVPFFSMAGSEFMEMLVGVGASRVRDLFETAKKSAPSIIFIDEMDAIGRTRGVGGGMGGHDEREQTLNQILVEMDGFSKNENVIVMAATNRPDVLDPALVRPGRFDRRVTLDLPDIKGRKEILEIHKKGKPFVKDLNWEKIAQSTVGFSGADLENMLNESAILAARHNRKEIEMKDIFEASLKVKMGPERKRLSSDLEKKMTAYHEMGHALVGHMLSGTDPIHRISIVSRGMALGFTMSRPKTDKYQQTERELSHEMAMMLGGRAAEKIVFNELTAGASNDIERATRIARRMVVDFGMSKLGPVSLSQTVESNAWGYSYGETGKISETTQTKIDEEVKIKIDDAYLKAEKILRKHRKLLDRLSEKLIEIETMEQEDFEEMVALEKGVFE